MMVATMAAMATIERDRRGSQRPREALMLDVDAGALLTGDTSFGPEIRAREPRPASNREGSDVNITRIASQPSRLGLPGLT
jgi:hypothetical protein